MHMHTRGHLTFTKASVSRYNTMILTACCIAFFGFLQSELTVPAQDTYDSTTHLSVQDVALDIKSSPTTVRISLKPTYFVKLSTFIRARQTITSVQ